MNQVCTHIADIDFGKISVYRGNYDFWYQASQLHLKQRQSENKKNTDRADELKAFIQRFSSNASKSKQATSRKKLLEKLTIEDIPDSSRKYPYICFKPERPCGKVILEVDSLTKTIDGEKVLNNVSFVVNGGDKIAFMGGSSLAKTTLFQILAGEMEPDSGTFNWGLTITHSYFPKEHSAYFNGEQNLIEWFLQFAPPAEGENFARTFLGRMLFSGEEAVKKIGVLSGGERVRCMLSRMMLSQSNVLILDDPTNHLDLESITSLNKSLVNFKEVILFTSHDHEFLNTVVNRIIEITPGGVIDRLMTFDEYIESTEVEETRESMIRKAA
jgi:ATPase subunit of ABC transporter with duplicated ATPase domains